MDTAEAQTAFDHVTQLLAAKDAQIELLTMELVRWQTQTDKLTDALTDERRRNDVLQLQAAQRPALPSDDRTTHGTPNRRELWVFALAVFALVLLAAVLLVTR